MRGMALESILEPRGAGRREAVELWKTLAAGLLATPATRPARPARE